MTNYLETARVGRINALKARAARKAIGASIHNNPLLAPNRDLAMPVFVSRRTRANNPVFHNDAVSAAGMVLH